MYSRIFLIFLIFYLDVINSVPVHNGNDAPENQYNFMVKLREHGQGVGGTLCGATILTNELILTEAHCVYNRRPADLVAAAGNHFFDLARGVSRRIHTCILHNQYYPDNDANVRVSYHDIAICKLKEKFTFDRNINKVKLWSNNNDLAVGTNVQVIGFGSIGYNTVINETIDAQRLQHATVKILRPNSCKRELSDFDQNLAICAGGQADTCDGDSGGPLMHGDKQIGIVLGGLEHCGMGRKIGAYVSIRRMSNWIENTKKTLAKKDKRN